jgi:transcription elongation factor GreA
MDRKEYLTQEKKDALESELHHLKTVSRGEIGERVATARALGDLSENAEYHAARAEQGKNESRIMEIESILKRVEIIERSKSGMVELGATVVVKKIDSDEEKKYMIVSDTEADMAQSKISSTSPIGSAMMGKSTGDTFEIATPRGAVGYTVISVE